MINFQQISYHSDSFQRYCGFAEADGAFCLDSSTSGGSFGRFDIFSAWPVESVLIDQQGIYHRDTDKNDHLLKNLGALKKYLASKQQATVKEYEYLPFHTGWFGFASYELAYFLEPHSGKANETGLLPAFWAGFYEWAVISDHQEKQSWFIYSNSISNNLLSKIQGKLKEGDSTKSCSRNNFLLKNHFRQDTDQEKYRQNFDAIQEYLLAGDCYQVNYAMRFKGQYQGSPLQAFYSLRNRIPSPFTAYIKHNDQYILSISPERFIQAIGKKIETSPIKGTATRQADPEIDQHIANELSASIKNRAENLMIVDLLRNDLGHWCEPGSIKVDKLFELQTFENVHHLVSTVSGSLRKEASVWDVFFDSFPGGSITGAPKIRACQIINELETCNREIYCGSIFYASTHGVFDSNIAIRTLLCNDGDMLAWAGGGIVRDSTADDEYQECQSKIGMLLKTLEDMQ